VNGCSFSPPLFNPSRLGGHPAGYNSTVDREALRAFASRDWQSAVTSKAEYWSTRSRQNPLSTWNAAQGLLAYVRRLRPSFPSEAARDEDLDAHIALRARLDRAAHAFTRR
jgi:hypothetical protein